MLHRLIGSVSFLLGIVTFVLGVWGLSDWLLGSGNALDDFGRSAWVTVVVVVVLLALIALTTLPGLQQTIRRAKMLQSVATAVYVFLVVLTINSLGAWLWPSALLSIITWYLSRRRRLLSSA
jgi:hypothetical protein